MDPRSPSPARARALRPSRRCFRILALLALLAPASTALGFELRDGDPLRITILDGDRLSGEYVVGPDGNVSLPELGLVPARGLDLRAFEA